ncbi:TonB-dependent receptor [Asaia bogorensis]|uniref:TonB-dependent receptor n=1 Tax=Asaia bogorensis TaxID=91915 RepID=A0A060QK87_9PROT|nr:TonB-dependent receptor [Asaia bogorensis]
MPEHRSAYKKNLVVALISSTALFQVSSPSALAESPSSIQQGQNRHKHHSTGASSPARQTTPVSRPAPTHRKAASSHAEGGSEAIIVTGTRSSNRRVRDSSSPITLYTQAQMERTGELNLASVLSRLDPSITVSALGNDTAALTSSIRMRGLSANEVLVLVDGKRRNITGNMAGGTTPVDLNMIPAGAIDHMEVLRDGAAAMYGSDAIAGVVNIITKKSDHGIHTYAQTDRRKRL